MEKKIKNTPITQLPYKPPLIISIDMWIKISHKLESTPSSIYLMLVLLVLPILIPKIFLVTSWKMTENVY